MWTPSNTRKTIAPAELDALIERQMNSASAHRAARERLAERCYPVARPLTIEPEKLEKSVARQFEEGKLREEKMEKLKAKYATPPPKVAQLPSDEIEGFATRMQASATAAQERRKQRIAQKQKEIEKEAKLVEKGRQLTKSDVGSMADRLSKPKEKLTYEREMEIRLGQKGVALPENFIAQARKQENLEAEAIRAKFQKKQ